jgi:hypothetical protein
MHNKLWESILKFDFDQPVSEYGFSTRLANENYWTKQFTETAILEYKKFMYLAATSDFMVSPSAIVDIVWHQHLIFTQSYSEFCTLLNKQIQHIPSTHNRDEVEKFNLAKQRTTKFYKEVFGEQPKDIWEYADMYDSLELPKAKLKIRTVVIIGILFFIAMLIPFYYLLKPIYVQIDNPYFLRAFVIISVFCFITLELYNRSYFTKLLNKFGDFTFIKKLHSSELVYLVTQKISTVVHTTVNKLIKENVITVNEDKTIEHTQNLKADNIEEHQVLDTLHSLGRTSYPVLIRNLTRKPVFGNVGNCINALNKYFTKSKAFGNLFYLNFGVLALLLMLGMVRLATGIFRDKPVGDLIIVLIVLAFMISYYLWRLTNLFCNKTIPGYYKKKYCPTWKLMIILNGNISYLVMLHLLLLLCRL